MEIERIMADLVHLREKCKVNEDLLNYLKETNDLTSQEELQTAVATYKDLIVYINCLSSHFSTFVTSLNSFKQPHGDLQRIYTRILVKKYQEVLRTLQFYDILSIVKEIHKEKKEVILKMDNQLISEKAFLTQIETILRFFWLWRWEKNIRTSK